MSAESFDLARHGVDGGVRALATSSPEGDQRQLLEWATRHYESYAERIGATRLVLSTAK